MNIGLVAVQLVYLVAITFLVFKVDKQQETIEELEEARDNFCEDIERFKGQLYDMTDYIDRRIGSE